MSGINEKKRSEGEKNQKTKKTGTLITFRSFGAGGRIRTADLFITSEPLYLLSHTSKTFVIIS